MAERFTVPQISDEERELQKRAIFDKLRPKRQEQILARGYENWDPFITPKDPVDIRTDATKRTADQLIKEFLRGRSESTDPSYGRAVQEMALGMVNGDTRVRAMIEFALWYAELLRREGVELKTQL